MPISPANCTHGYVGLIGAYPNPIEHVSSGGRDTVNCFSLKVKRSSISQYRVWTHAGLKYRKLGVKRIFDPKNLFRRRSGLLRHSREHLRTRRAETHARGVFLPRPARWCSRISTRLKETVSTACGGEFVWARNQCVLHIHLGCKPGRVWRFTAGCGSPIPGWSALQIVLRCSLQVNLYTVMDD
jgi:hypothetical protein